MPNFVEYLRAKRAIQIALILLGLFIICAIILRVTAAVHGHSIESWEGSLQHSPTAHVTRTTLADGSVHIVVNDPPRQTHAEIFERPDGRIDMEVTEPRTSASGHDSFSIGSVTIHERTANGQAHTIVHYTRDLPKYELGLCFLITIPMGLIVASLLGGALSKENDGHLDLAWTKPVSREKYAFAAVLIDAGAILLTQLLTFAATLLATLLFFVPRFSYGPHVGWYIVIALAGPLAWYACLTAGSASVKRGPGMVIGLGWVAALFIPGIAQGLQALAQVNAIAAFFYAIFRALSYIDPISYITIHGLRTAFFGLEASALILCALAIGYVLLAVAQWRRVEA
jgi:hypothetical protein